MQSGDSFIINLMDNNHLNSGFFFNLSLQGKFGREL